MLTAVVRSWVVRSDRLVEVDADERVQAKAAA